MVRLQSVAFGPVPVAFSVAPTGLANTIVTTSENTEVSS
jgi:hypothetical protein